jgi:hypothetical protein
MRRNGPEYGLMALNSRIDALYQVLFSHKDPVAYCPLRLAGLPLDNNLQRLSAKRCLMRTARCIL